MDKNLINHTVAVIGSFKQHYAKVLSAIETFRNMSIIVTSPEGSSILTPGIPFVRFASDNPNFSDEMIQTTTLKKILSAEVVYVVNPNGYVGKTTSYEIGRIIQSKKPIYFLDNPEDLPIKVPKSHIVNPDVMVDLILSGILSWPYEFADGEIYDAERTLISNK